MTAHNLRRVAGTTVPRRHVALDAISGPRRFANTASINRHLLWGWQIVGWSEGRDSEIMLEHHDGRTAGLCWGMIEAMLYAKEETVIWGYDLPKILTLLGFWERLESRQIEHTRWVLVGPPTIIRGTISGRPFQMIDLLNWVDRPLSEIQDLLGSGAVLEPAGVDMDACWHEYQHERVLTVHAAASAICRWIMENDLGNMASTVAGQAMQSYRRSGLNTPILTHTMPKFVQLEEQSHFGGQILTPTLGAVMEPIAVYDVNALFPYCMSRYPMPYKPLNYCDDCTLADLRRATTEAGVIAKVTIDSPIVPYPRRIKQAAVYQSGRFVTTLAGEDLVEALSRNHVHEVHAVATFACCDLFSQWCGWAWEQRCKAKQKGKNLEAHLWKRLMNGLYGKWASHQHIWTPWPEFHHNKSWDRFIYGGAESEEPRICRTLAGDTEYLKGRKLAMDTFPAISAFTTALARRYMHGLRCIVGEQNFVYQCVDELHLKAEGWAKLISANLFDTEKMGMLKLSSESSRSYYAGPNAYTHDGRLVLAGRPVNATRISEREYQYEIWQGLKEIIKGRPQQWLQSKMRVERLDAVFARTIGTHLAPIR